MRRLLLSVPLMLLAMAGPACGGADDPASESPTEPGASESFVVRLTPDTSKEGVTQQIVEAGQAQLAIACAGNSGASVRIFNPLASGDYTDVPCSAILDGGESVGQASEALTSGSERIGMTQQPLSPFSLVCSALMLGATLAWNWPYGQEGCNAPGAENPSACRALTSFGGGALGLLCALI